LDEAAVVGVTSNPSIFEKAYAESGIYEEHLRELVAAGSTAKEAFVELAAPDVAAACDLLHPVWMRTHGRDGHVSIEVDPELADDTVAQYEETKRLHPPGRCARERLCGRARPHEVAVTAHLGTTRRRRSWA